MRRAACKSLDRSRPAPTRRGEPPRHYRFVGSGRATFSVRPRGRGDPAFEGIECLAPGSPLSRGRTESKSIILNPSIRLHGLRCCPEVTFQHLWIDAICPHHNPDQRVRQYLRNGRLALIPDAVVSTFQHFHHLQPPATPFPAIPRRPGTGSLPTPIDPSTQQPPHWAHPS
jgi:hypothetical protein